MDQKTIAWVSYLTIVGWVIALISYNNSPDKSSLAKFHLRQSFGIIVTGVALFFVFFFLFFLIPFGFFFYRLLYLAIVIFAILGIVAAVNGEEKPVPLLGDFYQKTFTFIS